MIDAPRIKAIVFTTVVPLSDSAGVLSNVSKTMRFRDMAANTGSPSTCSLSISSRMRKLPGRVFPKPKPGSRMMSF